MNEFLLSPINIVVWGAEPATTYVMIGNVPTGVSRELLKGRPGANSIKYYGPNYASKLGMSRVQVPKYEGGDDHDIKCGAVDINVQLDDIEELLENKTVELKVKLHGAIDVEHESGVSYLTEPCIFPEDNFAELKSKIFIATGVPPYRQHLFYFSDNQYTTLYKIYADGVVPIDIRSLTGSKLPTIHGINVDKLLYEQRSLIKVEAYDVFRTLRDNIDNNTIYMVDLGKFTNVIRTQLIDMLSDKYQFELLYYGFIIKYWPQLTLECFYDYIANEEDLYHKYPDLAPQKSVIKGIERHASSIINSNYDNYNKLLTLANSDVFGIAITQLTTQVNGNRVMLNIRNIFEHFHTSMKIPEIRAWIEHENKRYLLTKRHVQSSEIIFPSGTTFHTGITFAISFGDDNRTSLMFLNIWPNGKYHIKTAWNEEDELGFDEIFTIVKKNIDWVIADINKLGYYAFISMGKLTILSQKTVSYQGINVCLLWKRVVTDNTYKIIKSALEPYYRGGIILQRNVQQFDKIEFTLHKGMYQFDTGIIEKIITVSSTSTSISNYYAYLSNQQVRQKWSQNYDGRIVRMSHRTSDIRFELIDVRDDEFKTAQIYILGFIHGVMSSDEFTKSIDAKRDYTEVKKLRKLREQDPELYDMKRHGSTRMYSIVCQNQRQPLIYTNDELKTLDHREKSDLTKYWNFTTRQPTYYGCPSKSFPHLSFMVGIHPKGYCLPCCNKKIRLDNDGRKNRIVDTCVEKHQWDEASEGVISKHVMSYGKDIDIGRLSKIPVANIGALFTEASGEYNYYIYGVAQHFPGVADVGIVYSIAAAMSMSPTEYIEGIIKRLITIKIDTLIGGILTEYFPTSTELIILIRELFIEMKVLASAKIEHWAELFIDLTLITYGISVAVFIDSNGTGSNIQLHTTNIVHDAIVWSDVIILMKRESRYYPIFVVNPDSYFKDHIIDEKIYKNSGKIAKLIKTMTSTKTVKTSLPTIENILGFLASLHNPGYTLVTQYVNNHNMCYGVLLEMKSNKVYLPCDYSPPVQGGTQTVPDGSIEINLDNVVIAINAINKYAAGIAGSVPAIKLDSLLYHADTLIGAATSTGATIYITSGGVSGSNIPIKHLNYDLRDVNKVIMKSSEDKSAEVVQYSLGKAIYNNYRYRLLIVEFVNYLDKERNDELREQLYALINETNFKQNLNGFRAKLKNLVSSKIDYSMIQYQVNDFYNFAGTKSALLNTIKNSTYDFDRTTLIYLQSLSVSDSLRELRKLVANFAVEGVVDDNIDFPNVYLPCEDSSANYCSNKRLIVDGLDEFVKVLNSDIRDEIRVAYLLNNVWMDTIVDTFQFTKNPTELITIYKLTE